MQSKALHQLHPTTQPPHSSIVLTTHRWMASNVTIEPEEDAAASASSPTTSGMVKALNSDESESAAPLFLLPSLTILYKTRTDDVFAVGWLLLSLLILLTMMMSLVKFVHRRAPNAWVLCCCIHVVDCVADDEIYSYSSAVSAVSRCFLRMVAGIGVGK